AMTDLAGRTIARDEKIVLTLSREMRPGEGRLALFIGESDVTSLSELGQSTISYTPGLAAYSAGENKIVLYFVDTNGNWRTLLDTKFVSSEQTPVRVPVAEAPPASSAEPPRTPAAKTTYGFTPNVAVNIKGQNQILTFPTEGAPQRNPFTDVDTQIGLNFKVSRLGWTLNNKFDLVGVGSRQNAIRFGELQKRAPMFDLSSYLIELSKGRFKLNLGHVSFGSNRHLINGFSSRGLTASIPVGKQTDITLIAANGTSVVGYDNFIGVTRRKHNMFGLGVSRELFKKRPNGLRVEFTVMRGSWLPVANFNQGVVNDAERSLGFGFRVIGSDTGQRLRYEAGFSRSRFFNPADPLLAQGLTVKAVREVWRNGRYAEVSYDILKDLALWKDKKLKLTGTFRHEELAPLYRSIGVSTQADRRQFQFEFSGNLGEMTFAIGNLQDRDNLNNLTSILKTLNRRNNVVIGIPLNTFFTPGKTNKWLPQVSYSLDRTHQFGASLPVNGEFRDPSQVPDQKNDAHSFNAQWVLNNKLTVGYRFTNGFQNNRQPGRELADFSNGVNGITVGYKPFKDLDLDIEAGREAQFSFEQKRRDSTFRIGTRGTWRTAFLKNSTLSAGVSATAAGDSLNQGDSRNLEFDAQWAYRFAIGTKKFKKLDTQFFIRYSNRYGSTINRVFFANNLNKTQAFNMGLTFNVF
ncbi:MAG: hypothetical protein ABL984_18435, partial [Pyrinomonadaceae bacterium]